MFLSFKICHRKKDYYVTGNFESCWDLHTHTHTHIYIYIYIYQGHFTALVILSNKVSRQKYWVSQKVCLSFLQDAMGKPERTFWPTQYNAIKYGWFCPASNNSSFCIASNESVN